MMPIGHKEWTADYNDHEIRFVNTWFSGASLYVDGKCVDKSYMMFLAPAGVTEFLTASLSSTEKVYVDVWANTSAKARIRVNDKQIGGDLFDQTSPEVQTSPGMILLSLSLIVAAGVLQKDMDFFVMMLVGLPIGAFIYGWIHQNNEVGERALLTSSVTVLCLAVIGVL
jgi:hypothetical protein